MADVEDVIKLGEEKAIANAPRDIAFGSVSWPSPRSCSTRIHLTVIRELILLQIAGMVSKVFEHPFDLVKVRLQSQPTDMPASFSGPWDCFKQTFTKEGWRGLYRVSRGLSMSLPAFSTSSLISYAVNSKGKSSG